MKIPRIEHPEKYSGLYLFDFGEQVAVGYTADEIAILLESERYRQGKVYRIHRALPDGTMELAGVPCERFLLEDGLFFYRASQAKAREDYDNLVAHACDNKPPCRMKVQLAVMAGESPQYVTAAIFPAEFTHAVGAWLNDIGYNGGDIVEGGASQVTGYYHQQVSVIDRAQLWSDASGSRSREDVLANTHLTIQRVPA